MKTYEQFYINGEWVDPVQGKNMFDVLNPANEEVIGQIAMGSAADVDNAVQAASKAFDSFSQTSVEERLAILGKIVEVYQSRYDEIAETISSEMGAPLSLSKAAQAATGLGHFAQAIEVLQSFEWEETRGKTVLRREPIGVVGMITPWNWPINQIALKVIPVLATGCTCVLKPSEHTPLSAKIYAEIIDEVGYPPGVFNLIQGDGSTVGAALSSHEDIQMMSFTGSTRAGTDVSRRAADTVKRVTLELGGKSPNIVFSDCNLEKRVTASVIECFLNSGQSCDAPTRLLVERSCYDQVLEIAKRAALSQKVADPMLEGDHIGPLFDKIQFDRVQNMIKVGIDEGAELLVGGTGRPPGFDRGWFVKPTVFFNVTNDMRVAHEEIFGPVLVIIPFEDEDDAINIANDTPYGLAAYLQTEDMDRAERVSSKLRAGAVHINGGAFNYGSPFGGFKQSGNGREGGKMGLEDFQEVKTLHFG